MSGVVAAGVGAAAVGGILASRAQRGAAASASGAQVKAAKIGAEVQREAMDMQRQQFQQMQNLLQPYVSAGQSALSQQLQMMGLAKKPGAFSGLYKWGGELTEKGKANLPYAGMTQQEYAAAKQREAIDQIAQSPELQALTAQGEEALMRNAAATGGLRSGNIQGALAQYRPAMLQQAIERRYSQLSGLTGLGQASAAGVGAGGMQLGSQLGQGAANISNLAQQAGAAQAGSALAAGQANAQMWSGLGQAAGMGLGGYLSRPQTAQGSPYGYQPDAQTMGLYQNQPIRVW